MSFLKAVLICQVLLCLGMTQAMFLRPAVRALALPYNIARFFLGLIARVIVFGLRTVTSVIRNISGLYNVRIARSLPDMPAVSVGKEGLGLNDMLASAVQYTA